MQHLLKLIDLSSKEIETLISSAEQMKYELSHGMSRPVLEGRTLGMIFQRPSTRTRVSFEIGMYQLGGHALYLPVDSLQMSRGEAPEDTARAMSRYCDGLLMRAADHGDLETLARYCTIPVINGQTDFAHPCQVLADLMTIREHKGHLDGLKVAFVGDGAAMMNSTIIGCLKSRMNVAVACPEGYDPDDMVLDYAAQAGHFEMYRDPRGAARSADVVITDGWIPSGREAEFDERMSAFSRFTVSDEVMNYARPDAMVLHRMPAHRGEEITGDIFEMHSQEIFDSAENLLHVQKAVLVELFSQM